MAGSVNRVILVGNLGQDPDIRTTQQGSKIASMSVATSESWKDKQTGERKENTQWHKIVVFSEPIVNIIEQYVSKGSKLYIEGQLETRKWQDQNGQDRYSTEVVLRPYRGNLTLLDSKQSDGYSSQNQGADRYQQQNAQPVHDDFEDEIPF